jgi:hypothetical protein
MTESMACNADGSCLGFLECEACCVDDISCTGTCYAAKGETATERAVGQCAANNCATECQLPADCGYTIESPGCNACVGGACCADMALCAADPACPAVLQCVGTCGQSMQCVASCLTAKPNDAANNLFACRNGSCANLCNQGAGGAAGSGG